MKAINIIKTIRTSLFPTKSLVISILLSWLFPNSVWAYDAYVNGIYYNLNTTDKTASVTYRTLDGNGYSAEQLTIPESISYDNDMYSVTSIGEGALYNCTGLTSVTIPNSVTIIGKGAFCDCIGLTSVTIPSSVTSIEGNAFAGCTGLTSVSIPNNVTSIGEMTFAYCRSLTSMTIPNSVTKIESNAFLNCTGLTSVTIPNSVTLIGYQAFYGCTGLTTVTIPNSVTSIGVGAFRNCTGLTTVGIPNSVTRIGELTFAYCTSLTSVTIPNSVTVIEPNAFQNCTGLTSVTIPSSVTYIGNWAFSGCTGLTSVTIPSSVTNIGNWAFSGCTGLTSITVEWPTPLAVVFDIFFAVDKSICTLYVPSGTKTAYENAQYWNEFGNIVELEFNVLTGTCGDNLIYTIYSDMSMVISGTGEMYDYSYETHINNGYYRYIEKVIIEEGVTSIGEWAFQMCTGLTSVTIPNSVTSIGISAFHSCRLTSVTIPNSVTSIGYGAFRYCRFLTSVDIPNSVTSIGDAAFADCIGLTSVDIPNSVTSISETAFYYCTGLTSVDIPNSVTSIGSGAFSYCTSLTSVEIPNSVSSIGDYAFDGCSSLTFVTIPSSVTSIGEGAFECSGLTSVTIPNSVTSISDGAFWSCTSLTSVEIPKSVTSIGGYAFCDCTGLTSITVEGETPASIELSSFEGVDKSICTLYVPYGSKSAYENAEYWNEFENIEEYGIKPTPIDPLDNAIYVDHVEGRIGGTMDIPIKVKNSAPIEDFKFKMILPAGTTVNSWALSSNRLPSGATVEDYFSEQNIEGNTITLACMLNYNESEFTGNDGEIATVNVTFGENMEVGTYPIRLTECNIGHIDLSDVVATLNLEDYVVGDANGDGRVRIGDASAILHYIVGNPSADFQEKAADVNGDGLIRIGDVSAVLKIIVGL